MTSHRSLCVAPGLDLPLEAVSQTFGILAVRGAGKSNAAAVMAEEMFAASLPFVVVDPKGDWFGLRAPGAAGAPGIPVPIFGGEHADVPLDRGGGAFLADLVADQRLSCVLDVSELTEGDKVRFLIDFAERLLRRNRHPLHLFLEEADDYIPQRPFREQARCVGAFQRIVKRGRFRGLGCTLITQRSAALNKDVLYMVETLLLMRTLGPKDRETAAGWVKHQGADEEVLDALPSLDAGEAFVYSPHWLGLSKPKKVRFRRRATFDSGQTPGATSRPRTPATLADVDLAQIRTRMAETIERARAEDPKELRARIASLEAELRKAKAAVPAAAPAERVEVPVLGKDAVEDLDRCASNLGKQAANFAKVAETLERGGVSLREAAESVDRLGRDLVAAVTRASRNGAASAAAARPGRSGLRAGDVAAAVVHLKSAAPARGRWPLRKDLAEHLEASPACQRILETLAYLESIGLPSAGRVQLAFLAGASPKSSTYQGSLSTLRQAGLLEFQGAGDVRLSEGGRAVAPKPERPPTTEDLHATLKSKLTAAQWRILETLISEYPKPLQREVLAEVAGASVNSSTYQGNLSWLRSLGVIAFRGAGEVAALPVLFLER